MKCEESKEVDVGDIKRRARMREITLKIRVIRGKKRKEKNRVYRIPWIEVKSEDGHIGEPACVEISGHGWTKGMISARQKLVD